MTEATLNMTYAKACDQAITHGGFPRLHVDRLRRADTSRDRPLFTEKQMVLRENLAARFGSGASALVSGPPGTGKTFLACAFGVSWTRRYNLERGKARYWTLAGLFGEQKEWFNRKDAAGSPIQQAKECGLLVIDEITPQNDSMYDQREARELIDFRYRNAYPTLLLTNLAPDRLDRVFDAATVDRLMEDGFGIFNLNGESMR
jgi:DNA replication protein DnaC